MLLSSYLYCTCLYIQYACRFFQSTLLLLLVPTGYASVSGGKRYVWNRHLPFLTALTSQRLVNPFQPSKLLPCRPTTTKTPRTSVPSSGKRFPAVCAGRQQEDNTKTYKVDIQRWIDMEMGQNLWFDISPSLSGHHSIWCSIFGEWN